MHQLLLSYALGTLRQAQGTPSKDCTFAELVEALVAKLLNLMTLRVSALKAYENTLTIAYYLFIDNPLLSNRKNVIHHPVKY